MARTGVGESERCADFGGLEEDEIHRQARLLSVILNIVCRSGL
jgi:hypothetical protein